MNEFLAEGDVEESEVKKALEDTVSAIEDFELQSTLSKEEDQLNCILSINAGAGGTESCDWAAMLMRMYIMWAEKNGFKVKELDIQDGDVAGIT